MREGPAAKKLTLGGLQSLLDSIIEESYRPTTMIMSPAWYRVYDWQIRKTRPWPVDFEMLLFPRWTRAERKIKRTWRRLRNWWRYR